MQSPYKKELILPFLEEIKNLKLNEMLKEAEEKLATASEKIKELKYHGESEEFSQSLKFYHDLKGLIFFLKNREKPETMQPKRFQRFKWIARKLVNIKELDESVLDLFNWD